MNDIRNRLEAGDPLRSEPPLADPDIQRMRRATIAAVDTRPTQGFDWRWAVVTAVLAIAANAGMNRWLAVQPKTDPGAEALTAPMATPRQMQFVTAGGTRVIWIFNPEFETSEGSNR